MGHLHAPSSHRLVHLLAALAAGRRDLERATRAGIARIAARDQSCVLLLLFFRGSCRTTRYETLSHTT